IEVQDNVGNFPKASGPITFSKTSVVPTTAGATFTMTVGTELPPQTQAANRLVERPGVLEISMPLLGVALLVGWRGRGKPRWLNAAALCLVLVSLAGCDGACESNLGKTTNSAPSPTLAPGTYTIAVNAAVFGAVFPGGTVHEHRNIVTLVV